MGMGWFRAVSHKPLPDYLCKNEEGDLSACYPLIMYYRQSKSIMNIGQTFNIFNKLHIN